MSLANYFYVLLISMFKFMIAPFLAYQVRLSFLESFVLINLGMMVSVLIFSFTGQVIKKRIINRYFRKRLFTARNRKLVKIWRRYGMVGIAFLTPILLTPPAGTLIATSFGEYRSRIYFYMLASSLFWSAITLVLVFFLGNLLKAHW